MKPAAQTNLFLKSGHSLDVMETEGSGALLGLDRLSGPLPSLWPWASYLTLWGLRLLIWKIGILIGEIFRVVVCHSFWLSGMWTLLPVFKACFHHITSATCSLSLSCIWDAGQKEPVTGMMAGGLSSEFPRQPWQQGRQCQWWHSGARVRTVHSTACTSHFPEQRWPPHQTSVVGWF